MAETDIEKAFATLAEALTVTESEINEEISVIGQQIEELKGRIIELQGKQETLTVDRSTIEEMYSKYCGAPADADMVEF